MRYANKVLSVDEAVGHVRSGSRLMLGEFVGAGEPACCIEALLASGVGQLTLITNTPGALQVNAEGNLANWACQRNGKWWPGISGAMDLCYGTRKVIAALAHTDKHGHAKILPRCTLPLTGRGCVKVIVTEHAVFDVTGAGLVLREILSHATLADIRATTAAPFTLAPALLA